jgi:ABC-type transport system involved in multi-copper enzyme maturation permease subunit
MSGYGLRQVGRMEWIKLRSVRSSGWLLAAALLTMVGTGIGVGLGYRSHLPVATGAQIVDNSVAGAVLAQLLIGALGVLVVTGEYSSGLIRATLAAVPRRGLVLAGKGMVFGAVAFLAGELGALVGYAAGQAAISGSPVPGSSLADPAVLRPVLLTGVYLGLVGLLGTGLGVLIRHSGGAIGALFGALFVPMFLAALVGPAGVPVLRFVPLMILANSVAVETPVPGALPAWAGIGVMACYAAATLGLGCWRFLTRDA